MTHNLTPANTPDDPRSFGTQPPTASKKPYSVPVLTDIGTVGQFSMGGSGPMGENMTGGNPMKHP